MAERIGSPSKTPPPGSRSPRDGKKVTMSVPGSATSSSEQEYAPPRRASSPRAFARPNASPAPPALRSLKKPGQAAGPDVIPPDRARSATKAGEPGAAAPPGAGDSAENVARQSIPDLVPPSPVGSIRKSSQPAIRVTKPPPSSLRKARSMKQLNRPTFGAPESAGGAGSPGPLHMYTSLPRSATAALSKKGANLGGEPARVVLKNGTTGRITNVPLVKQVTTLGRKEDNHIILDCSRTSKYHARITRESGSWSVTDLNSSNGVKVNDEQIEPKVPHRIHDGDVIQMGSISLSFYEEEAEEATGLPPDADGNSRLVTILPTEEEFDESFSIRAEIQADQADDDFAPDSEITSEEALRSDYENLRLAYQISKLALSSDVSEVLEKTLDLMFSVLPMIDRCVVLLVDRETQLLTTKMVKLREGKGHEGKEILLSSTILQRVYQTRTCLITTDACEDPYLGMAKSIAKGKIRSVISVPLIGHDKVLGILHLDSKAKIGAFVEKDMALVKTICNQTAVIVENAMLFKDSEVEIKAREQLSRFLPPQVVQKMIQAQEGFRKGGREMVGTVIFADIRGFTRLSERSTPSEVFDLLNDFFERLVKIVFDYNGIVDKYIGDALMSVFGTLDDEDSEFRSVAAALEFKEAVRRMNDERIRYGKEPISVGIGLNTGMLVSGFVGSSQRLEYTVIGDTVNTSSRICGLAHEDQVLISESTFVLVQNRIETRFVGQHQLKGKTRPVGVYEAIGIKSEGTQSKHVNRSATPQS